MEGTHFIRGGEGGKKEREKDKDAGQEMAKYSYYYCSDASTTGKSKTANKIGRQAK